VKTLRWLADYFYADPDRIIVWFSVVILVWFIIDGLIGRACS
jgi:hypothetical protein